MLVNDLVFVSPATDRSVTYALLIGDVGGETVEFSPLASKGKITAFRRILVYCSAPFQSYALRKEV